MLTEPAARIELTDEDRAAIRRIIREERPNANVTGVETDIYLAGLHAGAKRMQERAAMACDDLYDFYGTYFDSGFGPDFGSGLRKCAAAIRALDAEP